MRDPSFDEVMKAMQDSIEKWFLKAYTTEEKRLEPQ